MPTMETQNLKMRIAELESQLTEVQHGMIQPGHDLPVYGNDDNPHNISGDTYHNLIENANDAILVAQDNAFAYFNRRTSELTGYTYDELKQLPFVKLIHPDDRALVVNRYQKRLAGEEVPDVYNFRALKKNGEDFWVEIHAVRIEWKDHPAILCFLTDISQYRLTETNLAESEQRYRNIVELSPYGIVTLDTKGVIVACNSTFVNLTGYSHSDFVGRHFSRIPTIRLRDVPQFLRIFARLVREGFNQPIEFAWIHQDGTERWGEARGVLLRSDEKISGLQGIIRDITEQRRASQLLEALNSTALAVAQVTKAQEIFSVMGEELTKLKIAFTIFMLQPDGKHVIPAYMSYNSRAVKMAERLLGENKESFIVEISKVDAFKQIFYDRATILSNDPVSGAQQMLPDALKVSALQLINILDVKTSINAPLIIEDQVIGMLSVQSDVLREVDVPAITAFANLMSAALHKAHLLEQAQSELEERRKAESEIQRLQQLVQNITDSMPSALITLDLDGHILTHNPAVKAILSQFPDLELEKTLWQVDTQYEIYHELFQEVLRTGESVTRHHVPFMKGETNAFHNISAFPLVVDTLQGVVLRIDDVTEYVKLQDLMLQSAKLASVGGLATGVAHEINNPLAAMIQSAQMIQLSLDLQNAKTKKRLVEYGINPDALEKYVAERHVLDYIDGIREAGGRAAKIVTDLLAFSRRSSSEMVPVDLNDLIDKTLDLAATDYNLTHHYDFRDIKIVKYFDDNLPSIVCDSQQIQQVVLNLVKNAAQALVAKSYIESDFQPRITIRSTVRDNVAHISIEDNGVGLDKTVIDHIFEPFFTTKEIGEGTGLGLWLSWSIIVERHKGQMWVDPLPEGGVRFTIELPVGKSGVLSKINRQET